MTSFVSHVARFELDQSRNARGLRARLGAASRDQRRGAAGDDDQGARPRWWRWSGRIVSFGGRMQF